MAYSFGDGFDLYATAADMINGYWDGSSSSGGTFPAGRFSNSRAVSFGPQNNVQKISGANDAVHHFVVSFNQNGTLSGTVPNLYIILFDGATAQCSVVFRSDGAILLTSGTYTGTTLATYTGAVTASSTWYAFEFEVVVNSATGSFAVRKNGNTVNDFSATALNTRGGTTNNYANKVQLGMGSSAAASQITDDFFWQSGAATGAWLGDIRCYARMPASDASVTFSRTGVGALTQTVPTTTASTTTNPSNNVAWYTAFSPFYSGTVTSVSVQVSTVGTAVNMKCAIYADNAGVPGAILASAVAPVTPVIVGAHVFAFSPGVTVTKGVAYWVASVLDGSGIVSNYPTQSAANQATGASGAVAYASFPQANPVVSTPAQTTQKSWTYTATPANWQAVSEAQEDGLTSYVFDSNPGDADFYGIASIASTPAVVVATTVRAYAQKSDAGTRTMAVQLRSGSGPPSSVWSASDAATNVMTLTNSGLTVNYPGAANWVSIRGTNSRSSGKLYVEFILNSTTDLFYLIGLASAGFNIAGNLGNTNYSFGTTTSVSIGTTFVSTGFVSHYQVSGGVSVGDVIAMAVDFSAGNIWFSQNNIWWNGSNPVTNSLPIVTFTPATVGALFPAMSFHLSNAGAWTIQPTAASQKYAAPSGFSAWDVAGATTVASPTLVLTTSGFLWAWRTDLVDPATGAAWTPAAVNNAQIGPKVIT